MASTEYNAPDRENRRKVLRGILQEEGRQMSTDEIHEELQERLERTYSCKTTRRDLVFLSKQDPAVVTEVKDKKKRVDLRGRCWTLNRASYDLVLAPPQAMSLIALFQHGERFGFGDVVGSLKGLRDYAAGSVIAGAKRNLLAEGRIRSGTRFAVLSPGKHNEEHLETIQNAMRDDHSLKMEYRPREVGDVICTYFLKPLALSYQDSNIYLSTYVGREEWPAGKEPDAGTPRGKYSSNGPGTLCALMLHRVVSVRTMFEDIKEPLGYDPESLEAQRDLMTIHGDGPVNLKLRLSPNLHNRLTENPLTDDQVMSADRHGWVLDCRIAETQGLRLFLLSNARDIEVLAPPQLREHLRETLHGALKLYDRED